MVGVGLSKYSNGKLWIFEDCFLYNVMPQSSSSDLNFRLFSGNVHLQELFRKSNENSSMTHTFQIKFYWPTTKDGSHDSTSQFCNTSIISDHSSMTENIIEQNQFYYIRMDCDQGLKVMLGLTFAKSSVLRDFRDVLFRINEEYEILADMDW